jgi:hypothetical protein
MHERMRRIGGGMDDSLVICSLHALRRLTGPTLYKGLCNWLVLFEASFQASSFSCFRRLPCIRHCTGLPSCLTFILIPNFRYLFSAVNSARIRHAVNEDRNMHRISVLVALFTSWRLTMSACMQLPAPHDVPVLTRHFDCSSRCAPISSGASIPNKIYGIRWRCAKMN